MNTGRGGDTPPANGGEFLLQLLRKSPNPNTQAYPPHQQPSPSQDPAVAAVGPTISAFYPPHVAAFPSDGRDLTYAAWNHATSPPLAPHNYFPQNPNLNPILNPDFCSPPGGFSNSQHRFKLHSDLAPAAEDTRKLRSYAGHSSSHQQQLGENLVFGSLICDVPSDTNGDGLRRSLHRNNKPGNSYLEERLGMDMGLNSGPMNPVEVNGGAIGKPAGFRGYEPERGSNCNNRLSRGDGNHRVVGQVTPPPGFSGNAKNVKNSEYGYGGRNLNVGKDKFSSGDAYKNDRLSNRLKSVGPSAGSSFQSVSASEIEKSMMDLYANEDEELRHGSRNNWVSEMDGLDRLVGSLAVEDNSGEKRLEDESDKKKHYRDKEYRSDKRGQWIMAQRMRIVKSRGTCRNDIHRLNGPFLTVFESLIPPDEEKFKQKQLLTVLEKLVGKEWPEARLHLYGSCANSFGFSKSDIDICLQMDLGDKDKAEVLLKLAETLQSGNLQNVQALTRARVPVVKLMDPATGISCDICINNVLAVVNTKLLHDYARIDVRLRQLAFIVKHWAKSRGVNETYQGTLSSYAYVLMCIHFLQQRRPAILPCLQGMVTTYFATVENVECAYFDQVEKLQNFGSRNGESIAQLVWAFFHYWAYCHDYASDVISVRTGSTLSKRTKDWTKRVGNDRHLICIEDPFEVSHDLGRVVDKHSIRVIREEFERAAEIMQYDPNPCVTLFQPYAPN
ncbi:Nucleotidyltransferase family protein [Striga hermonthica]|uniref:RNA uridylyltransferase n=1 Tax=Striga hermonthica TaxID=68872 RepID=A0A9N7RAI9_STRHE|nr:Nucleotidyltransferase family protein [Striga hermonthica]